jgi:hypothetical protein
VAALIGFVAACGGGDDDEPPGGGFTLPPLPVGIATSGRFVDAPVAGLSYACNCASAVTDAGGEFDFTTGQTCSFAVGGIVLGSALGATVLTPISLVSGATDENHPTVNNISRLLLSLDGDGDPNNGVEIADSVRAALAGATLNVGASPAVFAPAAQSLLDAVMPGRTLVSASAASDHLGLTLLGLLSGRYTCRFGGPATGSVSIEIADGVITGSGLEDGETTPFAVTGTVQSSGSTTITAGTTRSAATFSGTFLPTGSGSGTWSDPTVGQGSWLCTR